MNVEIGSLRADPAIPPVHVHPTNLCTLSNVCLLFLRAPLHVQAEVGTGSTCTVPSSNLQQQGNGSSPHLLQHFLEKCGDLHCRSAWHLYLSLHTRSWASLHVTGSWPMAGRVVGGCDRRNGTSAGCSRSPTPPFGSTSTSAMTPTCRGYPGV